jgi:regulator of sirC expression with transglutaminase-like and TPR domain
MSDALAAFTEEVRRADSDLDLGRAALLIAHGEYPELSIATSLALLEEVAVGVAALLPPGAEPRSIAHAIRKRLFHDLEFRVNEAEFYDPRNSYLNDVLVRRLGIPVSLTVVFLEVARRVGLEAFGVSYPRRFLIKYVSDGQEWIVDPYLHGEEFSGADFRAHMAERGSTPEHVLEYYLAAVTRRQLLTRMLTNLKGIYTSRPDHERALRIQEYLLAINPWSFEEIRDRGILRERTGDRAGALADLETYRQHAPEAEDAAFIRRLIDRLAAGGG